MNTPDAIDRAMTALEQEDLSLDQVYATLGRTQPVLVEYLTSDDTIFLSDEEHDYLLYLAAVLIRTLTWDDQVDANPEELEEVEESLWAQLNKPGAKLSDLNSKVPRDAALNDFILDAVGDPDEPDFLTEPGAQMLFCKLASLATVLESSSDL